MSSEITLWNNNFDRLLTGSLLNKIDNYNRLLLLQRYNAMLKFEEFFHPPSVHVIDTRNRLKIINVACMKHPFTNSLLNWANIT